MAIKPDDKRQSAAGFITLLLRERQQRIERQCYTQANDQQLKELCSILLWMHSEACGKYQGCRYWSEGARQSFQRYGKVVTNKRIFGGEALRHEHLFPRNQLIKKLLSLDHPSLPEVKALLDRLNIGVVVTVEEDERLPSEGIDTDPWDRYRKAGVRWLDTIQKDGV